MPLRDYEKPNDYFIYDSTCYHPEFDFPCCLCMDADGPDNVDPCRKCGYNVNSKKGK